MSPFYFEKTNIIRHIKNLEVIYNINGLALSGEMMVLPSLSYVSPLVFI